jgi:hypothetical protein
MIERAASGKSSSQTPDWRLYYWSWVAALFVWATWQRFALPLDPIADPDTWGYLAPALRKLVGAEFGHTYGRNFVYPAFIFSLLRAFGDFRAIVITQHLLGLLAGGMLLITWRRALVFVPDSRLSGAAHDGLGLLGATIFLLAGEPMRFEMQLRPEGVCAFLVSISLYLAIQFMACCFVEKRPGATVGYGIGATFTSLLLASAKPSFLFVAVVALLPIAVFFFRRGWFRQKIQLAAGAAVSAALLLVPEHFLSRTDEVSRTFLPISLFAVHANLIRDQLADDVKDGAEGPYPREWLRRVHEVLSTEIAKSHAARPGYFWSLGFDPDYLMFEKNSIVVQLRREFGNDVPALCDFYRYYYWRVWRERPFLVIRKIQTQMSLFYSEMCPAYNREKSLSLANGYADGAAILRLEPYPELWRTCPPAVEFMGRAEMLVRSAPTIRQPAPLRITLSLLSGLYRPLLWSGVALSGFVLFQKRHRRRLGWLAALVLFVYSYNVASCLEAAIIQSLEVRRFATVQVFFTLFAQLFALWLLCEVALEIRVRAKALPRLRREAGG